MEKKKVNIINLLISIAIAELVGLLSALLAGTSSRIAAVYQSLTLPPLSPPGWVFPVAWTILYALMGIAAYLVFQASVDTRQKQTALIYYAAQLLVNFLWSIVFFRYLQFEVAIALLVLLILLLIITIVKFFPINRTAAYLLLPYLAWISFALYLNIGVSILN